MTRIEALVYGAADARARAELGRRRYSSYYGAEAASASVSPCLSNPGKIGRERLHRRQRHWIGS